MSTDIESIEAKISHLESEIIQHETEIARLRSEVERKSLTVERLRPAIQTIRDFVAGRDEETDPTHTITDQRPSDADPHESQPLQGGKRLDIGGIAEQILREASGRWLSFHDVAKIAASREPKLKAKRDSRELARIFNKEMKMRQDFEHQGTWFRIAH